jgi:hypothetical protein
MKACPRRIGARQWRTFEEISGLEATTVAKNARHAPGLPGIVDRFYTEPGSSYDRQGFLGSRLTSSYQRCPDAVADLGKPEAIGEVFAGFQKYLYQVA